MATPIQAKVVIDAAVVQAKNEIDNVIPANANISGGNIAFAPTQLLYILDAGGVAATAQTLLNTIVASLNAAGRNPKVTGNQGRRGGDPTIVSSKVIIITTALTTYNIINIG